MPCLHDRYQEGGAARSEYFWQDLLVARMIFNAKPARHIDVGSRIDGFVAHVASFREIEVFDIRPITTHIPGVTFKQADLMDPLGELRGCCDSLSCLHALEHFGLGRYGDTIDPNGFRKGLGNMSKMLAENGVFYLSVPIGQHRVEFNGHRVFDPRVIVKSCESHSLQLISLTTVDAGGQVTSVPVQVSSFQELSMKRYSLGIFVFCKYINA